MRGTMAQSLWTKGIPLDTLSVSADRLEATSWRGKTWLLRREDLSELPVVRIWYPPFWMATDVVFDWPDEARPTGRFFTPLRPARLARELEDAGWPIFMHRLGWGRRRH